MLELCARCLQRFSSARRAVTSRRWQSSVPANGSISPTALAKARSMANEHAALTEKLATEFDSNAAKRLGELTSTTSALKEYEQALGSLEELHCLLKSTDKELQQLAEDDIEPTRESIEQASSALKSSLTPIHPFAHLPCLIEIKPGAGGDEAGVFAGDLLRMYENFCGRKGLKTALLKLDLADHSASSLAASATKHVSEAVLEVESPGAYGVLRCEAGVHRVQRVPTTEKQGRTHTSAVSVLVLPSLPSSDAQSSAEESFNDPKSDYYVDQKDVRTEVMRAGGAGGQHVNKTESAIRLTHEPTGIVVAIQESRSQMRNREKAWQLLRSRIAQQRREAREDEQAQMRRGAGAGKAGRENKVRTYNYNQQRVSDHRSGLDSRNLGDVVDGGQALEDIMESVRTWVADREMLDSLAGEESKVTQVK